MESLNQNAKEGFILPRDTRNSDETSSLLFITTYNKGNPYFHDIYQIFGLCGWINCTNDVDNKDNFGHS